MSVALTINVGSSITVQARDPRIVAVGTSGPAGPANSLAIGTVTTGAAGSSASATITGTAPSQTLSLAIPRGDTGNTGTAATVAVGTTTTGAAGSSAAVTNSGSSSAAVLNFTVPRGNTGDTGPANSLAIGTVTTGAAGSSASATITGTAPSQTLSLTIPRGNTGATGDWSTAQTLNAQTGTSYTLVAGDVGKLVTFSNAATVALSVPTGLGITAGQRVDLAQLGGGQVQVGGTANILANPTANLRTQYSAATLICTATDTYLLVGDLAVS
jgi:hypothetical protein